MIFIPDNAEKMSHALTTHAWLSSQFQNFYLFDPIYEASGGKAISELCDRDINLDTALQTDLLDNPVTRDKCMFGKLSA
jgi:hypothetical protein